LASTHNKEGRAMKTLKQLIEGKNRKLVAAAPDDTVLHALEILAEHDIGALLVLEGTRLAGVFSERDYARKVILRGKDSGHTKISEVMTSKVFYVTQSSTIEECMAIMTEKHVRHLPVLDADHHVIGIVSIGDVVKETISKQQFIIDQLERYITG
jgi:CBS domain-containing protein